MSMGMGGNPYGPAGTGKTESVKALGGLFGRQVLVFNCDEVFNCNGHFKINDRLFYYDSTTPDNFIFCIVIFYLFSIHI